MGWPLFFGVVERCLSLPGFSCFTGGVFHRKAGVFSLAVIHLMGSVWAMLFNCIVAAEAVV